MDESILFKSSIPECNLELYFTKEELNAMELVEKVIKFNRLKNYLTCKSLGLELQIPEFMVKNPVRSKKRKSKKVKKMSPELVQALFNTKLPSIVAKSGVSHLSDEAEIQKLNLDLPLLKDEKLSKELSEFNRAMLPITIKKMKKSLKVQKRAIELCKKERIPQDYMHLFFSNDAGILEEALKELRQKKKEKKNIGALPAYSLRRRKKKNYCENGAAANADDDDDGDEGDDDDDEFDATKEDDDDDDEGDDGDGDGKEEEDEEVVASKNLSLKMKKLKMSWDIPDNVAAKSVPDGLVLKCSDLAEAVVGVFTLRRVEEGTVFGPYQGITVYDREDAYEYGYCWHIYVNDEFHHCIDGRDANRSNWMRYVNPIDSDKLQNLEAFQQDYKVYFRAMRDIAPFSELLVWYSPEYNQDFGRPHDPSVEFKPTASLQEILSKITDIKIDCEEETKMVSKKRDSEKKIKSKDYAGKKFQCGVCSYGSDNIGHLKVHERTHTGEKPYKCSMCDFSCITSGNLKVHELTHTGEKPYKCSMCEYSCNQSGSLKVHELTHTGEKPYKCSMCEFFCITSGSLKVHELTHTGEKPYKCSMCEFSCNQSGHLKVHERTHTGEKPYKCPLCGKAFSRNSHLLRHKRTVHTR